MFNYVETIKGVRSWFLRLSEATANMTATCHTMREGIYSMYKARVKHLNPNAKSVLDFDRLRITPPSVINVLTIIFPSDLARTMNRVLRRTGLYKLHVYVQRFVSLCVAVAIASKNDPSTQVFEHNVWMSEWKNLGRILDQLDAPVVHQFVAQAATRFMPGNWVYVEMILQSM